MEGRAENGIVAVIGAVVCVRGIGCGFEHLVVPTLVEEGLPDMHKGTGMRDERADDRG